MSNIPEQLKYTDDHDWLAVNGEEATLGLSDFAQNALGDIVFVELPEPGEQLEKGSPFGVVESIKSVSDLISPVTGEVLERNDKLSDAPDQLNANPYNSWMIKIKLSDTSEIDSLMGPDQYKEHCANAE